MTWLVWMALITLVGFQIATWRKLDRITEELKVFRTRQSNIAFGQMNVKNPHIERARTSVRDRDDLPRTARITRGVHRKAR